MKKILKKFGNNCADYNGNEKISCSNNISNRKTEILI